MNDEPVLNEATPDSEPALNVQDPVPAPAEPAENQPPAETAPSGDEPALQIDAEENKEVNEFSGAPETYEDFTMPEMFQLDDEGKAEASELFRKLNLSQKGAQSLIDAFTARVTAIKEAEVNQLSDQRKAWRTELQSRPNYASDRAKALKGLRAVVTTPEEKALFQDSWLCDHPAVFSLFTKIGERLGEDSPLKGGGGSENTGNVNLLRFPMK
jgi:hypothetical protein